LPREWASVFSALTRFACDSTADKIIIAESRRPFIALESVGARSVDEISEHEEAYFGSLLMSDETIFLQLCGRGLHPVHLVAVR